MLGLSGNQPLRLLIQLQGSRLLSSFQPQFTCIGFDLNNHAKSELNVFSRPDAKGNIVFVSEPLVFRNCSLFFLKFILGKITV